MGKGLAINGQTECQRCGHMIDVRACDRCDCHRPAADPIHLVGHGSWLLSNKQDAPSEHAFDARQEMSDAP